MLFESGSDSHVQMAYNLVVFEVCMDNKIELSEDG
jgi:hypothetical protein